MFKNIRYDIETICKYDPAVKSVWEVLLCYPGLHAVTIHRLNHRLHGLGWLLLARVLSQIVRFFTGIEIHPGASLGRGVFIDHGFGVVIGETAIVGDHCIIYQGVTLGGTGKESGKRHPTLDKHVIVGAGAKVLGNIIIGEDTRIGAGSVVIKDVPCGSTVVGIPGRIVRRMTRVTSSETLEHADLPDPLETVAERINRVDAVTSPFFEDYSVAAVGGTRRRTYE